MLNNYAGSPKNEVRVRFTKSDFELNSCQKQGPEMAVHTGVMCQYLDDTKALSQISCSKMAAISPALELSLWPTNYTNRAASSQLSVASSQ